MHSSSLVGYRAEELAVSYLQRSGYKVLCRNWRCLYGELDIIGIFNNKLCFFEVKYRSEKSLCLPHESINWAKICKLRKTIYYYLLRMKYKEESWTLDGLCISPCGGSYKLTHYKDILSDF